jgi:hypothetical protein
MTTSSSIEKSLLEQGETRNLLSQKHSIGEAVGMKFEEAASLIKTNQLKVEVAR